MVHFTRYKLSTEYSHARTWAARRRNPRPLVRGGCQASRMQNYTQAIILTLNMGNALIIIWFFESSTTYQVHGRGLDEKYV